MYIKISCGERWINFKINSNICLQTIFHAAQPRKTRTDRLYNFYELRHQKRYKARNSRRGWKTEGRKPVLIKWIFTSWLSLRQGDFLLNWYQADHLFNNRTMHECALTIKDEGNYLPLCERSSRLSSLLYTKRFSRTRTLWVIISSITNKRK